MYICTSLSSVYLYLHYIKSVSPQRLTLVGGSVDITNVNRDKTSKAHQEAFHA